jgi:hypothetical protein
MDETVDLDGLVGRVDGEPAGLQLRLGGSQAEVLALVLQPGGAVGQQPGGLDLGSEIGELGPDRLELRDRLTERVTLLRAGERLIERALGKPDAHRGDADAADVEHGQELLQGMTASPEQALLRDAAIGELIGRMSEAFQPIFR